MGTSTVTPAQQQAHIDIEAEYMAATTRSAEWAQRTRAVLPGGETRAVTSYPPHPVVVLEAEGSRLLDADGRSYLDLVNNYTSLIHGNAFAPVTGRSRSCCRAESPSRARTRIRSLSRPTCVRG